MGIKTLSGQEDKSAVSQVTLWAGHSLLPMLYCQKGVVYIVGDEHYKKIEMGAGRGVLTGEPIPKFPTDRKTFLQDKLTDPVEVCLGFVPVTEEALEELTNMKMKEVQKGFKMQDMPNI